MIASSRHQAAKNHQFLFFLILPWLAGCGNPMGTQESVTRALNDLSRKDYAAAWVVCSDVKSGRYVQFYVSEHRVFFDLPLGSWSYERRTFAPERAKADSISGGFVYSSYVSPEIRGKLAEVLTASGLSFHVDTVGFLDPRASTTDTTGWIITYRGCLEDHARGYDLVNAIFRNAYGLPLGTYTITLEEQ